nr:glycoside hydrolase family 130 protein [Cryptosporangium arvum]
MTAPVLHRTDAGLRPDPSRVVARLFLPGEELPRVRSRVGAVVTRVLALPDDEVEQITADLLSDYSTRHRGYRAMLVEHAAVVRSHIGRDVELSDDRTLLLGAAFTAEFAVEGAALCNPSAVLAPDQSGTAPGQVRVALSLRSIGEGHFSSIGFCSALAGPGPIWSFEDRARPLVGATTTPSRWRIEHLRSVLADEHSVEELASAVLAALPAEFTVSDLDRVLAHVHPELLTRLGARSTVDALRRVITSTYDTRFEAGVELAQQVLLPAAADESNGMEDARFVRFEEPDGTVEYRATYTAYDGQRIAPRLLRSPDLRSFGAHRLSGPAARNKGMALFPRTIGGRYFSLCRSDGESTSVSSSADGYRWETPQLIHPPQASWEILQVGNCGPPIETERGWLVLTHGVGAMRTYSIGAILLDLDDPTRLVGRLERPLLQPAADQREGYVPNVVYSCGGLVHDGILWLPYGVGDALISVGWTPLGDLLEALN